MRPLLLALVLGAAPTLGAAEGEVRAEARLHLRATDLTDLPSTEVLYQPASRTFDLGPYLDTRGQDRFLSTIAAIRLEGRHLEGALRWTLAVDTGELRRKVAPGQAAACAAPAANPLGLASAATGPCAVLNRRFFALPAPGDGRRETLSNDRPVGEEFRSTLFLREANLAVSFGRAGFATVRVGRVRATVADGLIHDDDVTGVDAALDLGALGPPFEVRLALFQPTRDLPGRADEISPMATLRVDWIPSLFEHAGLFLAARRDRSGGVAELLRGGVIEDRVVRLAGLSPGTAYANQAQALATALSAPLGSTATLTWVGTSGSLVPWHGQRLLWTAALLRGRLDSLTVGSTVETRDDPLTGRAVQLRWEASPVDWLTVTPWFLYLSGDRSPSERLRLGLPSGYAGFLGVTPLVTATNLFFGGGLSESFSTRQSTAPGVNGRGVLAPGLTVVADAGAEVDLTLRVAWLRAEVAGPYAGRVYGTELDVGISWAPLPWLTVGAEHDLLFPGDFFAGTRTISKTVLAVDLVTP